MNVVTHYLQKEFLHLLKTEDSMFEFMQKGALDGIWYWDLEKPEHEWMDNRFWTTLGFDPSTKKHLASEWQDLIFEEDLEIAIQNFKLHCDNPAHAYDQTVRYRHKQGHVVWIRCRGLAIRNDEGTPIRMLGVHTDVTDLKKKELALNRANEELTAFTHLASHDLKTPLRSMVNLVEFIREDLESEPKHVIYNHLERMEKATCKMNQLVNDLLQFIACSNEPQHLEEIQFSSLMTPIIDDLEELLTEKAADLLIQGNPNLCTAPGQLRQIIYNLVQNALHYCHPERTPTITICAQDENKYLSITVEDNGIGIARDKIERVFEPFTRFASAHNPDGSGLGLSICRKSIQNLGGRIYVEPERAIGTKFVVELPHNSRQGQ